MYICNLHIKKNPIRLVKNNSMDVTLRLEKLIKCCESYK